MTPAANANDESACRLLPNHSATLPLATIQAERVADAEAPVKSTKATRIATVRTRVKRRGALARRSTASRQADTTARWLPDTATRCETPAREKASLKPSLERSVP